MGFEDLTTIEECLSKELLHGVLTDRPDLIALWSDKNTTPIRESRRDHTMRVLWECPDGAPHEPFIRAVSKIFQTMVCPVCTFLTLEEGFNDIATTHPDLLDEWSSKNTIRPQEVMNNNSKDKILWVGKDCGHEWEATIQSRITQNSGCNYCNGRLVLAGFNDFATHYPEYVQNWSPENTFKPTEVSKRSNKSIIWICDAGHELKRSPKEWVKHQCWFCSGRKLLKGFNDLASTNPELVAEWDVEKNDFAPDEIRFNHREKAWWKCEECDVSWSAVVRSRVRGGTDCPSCAETHSFLEEIVYSFVKAHYDGVILKRQRPVKNGDSYLELDLWLPELNFAIEVHDFTTHSRTSDSEPMRYFQKHLGKKFKKGPTYHERKRRLAAEQLGVEVFDLWEDTVRLGDAALFEALSAKLNAVEQKIANPKIDAMMQRRRESFQYLDTSKHAYTFHEFNCLTRDAMLSWVCDVGHAYTVSMRQQMLNIRPCPECRGW